MRRLVVFFSWQSDIPDNHSTIKSGLEKACKKLSQELNCEVIYDESLRGELGSPQIEGVVVKKIHDCDVFVADLTPVAELYEKRLPNSNVMYELGRAEESHGHEQIVKLANKDNFDANKLPFDINHSSILPIDITDKEVFYHLIKREVKYAYDCPQNMFSKNDETLYSDFQIQKNIKSGKYLPDTFLEKRDLKEHLRYFVDPYLFTPYVADKIYRLNFDRLNRGRRLWNKPKFNFNVTQFKVDKSVSSFSHLYEPLLKMREYIKEKGMSLSSQNSNEDYFSSTKCGKKVTDLTYLTSKLCLLTGNAGQGKTNFLCDFTENVLLKRHIPFAYVNGYEVDATDVEKVFVKTICPSLDISFSKMMDEVAKYCYAIRKPIVFIIDGLNENPYPEHFAISLEKFLKRFLAFDFVKIIMTCRSEYFDENFSSLLNAFCDDMIIERDIYQHIHDGDEELLLKKYFRYFNIVITLDEGVKTCLTNNLLLLRIFCEANRDKHLGVVSHIKRDELFTAYFDKMLSRLAETHDWEGRKVLRTRKIKNFFSLILKYMIQNDTFFNVPIEDLFEEMEEEDENMLLRFLDENILLRKDLSGGKKSLARKTEIVNFTYDTFRDYLLAHYILDTLSENVEEQKTLIHKYTHDGHQLKEGIIPYLLVHAKNEENREILDFEKSQPWYIPAFKKYIWDVDESKVTEDDIALLKSLVLENPEKLAKQLLFRGRWNTKLHPKLNILILLKIVSQMDDAELYDWINKIWPSVSEKYWVSKQTSERESFVSLNEEILGDEHLFDSEDAQFIFEFFAYVAAVTEGKAKYVYLCYIRQSQNWEQVIYLSSHAKSEKVRSWMFQIISER